MANGRRLQRGRKTGRRQRQFEPEPRRRRKGITLHVIDTEGPVVQLVDAANIFISAVTAPVDPAQRLHKLLHRQR